MKRILAVLMVLAFAVAPLVALAAPKLPFESVTSQSRNYGGQSDGLCFVGVVTGVPGAASTTNDDSLIISTWKWRGSLIDPDSVGRNAFDWPSGTNGDDAFVGGQWYLTVTQTADNAAPVGEYSPITDWDASTGQVVVSPVFSAVVAVGERVAIVHRSVRNSAFAPITLKTTTTAWAATKGPVTNTLASCFTLTGMWRIEALGAVNVAGNSGTATNMTFACGQSSGTGLLISATTAIASDAAGSGYVVVLTDTSATPAVRDVAALTMTRIHPITLSGLDYWVTPPTGTLIICDSTSATNTGTRYLWIRATPLTPGATLTAN